MARYFLIVPLASRIKAEGTVGDPSSLAVAHAQLPTALGGREHHIYDGQQARCSHPILLLDLYLFCELHIAVCGSCGRLSRLP